MVSDGKDGYKFVAGLLPSISTRRTTSFLIKSFIISKLVGETIVPPVFSTKTKKMKKISMMIIGLIIVGILYVVLFGIPLWGLLYLTNGVHGLDLTLDEVLQLLAIILFVKMIPVPSTFSQDLTNEIDKYKE